MNKFNISKEEIVSSNRYKPNYARDTGIYILHMHTNFSNAEIGRLFGISLSAVTKASGRIKRVIERDGESKRKVNDLINSIFKV